MEFIPVTMTIDNLEDIPDFRLPGNYRIRLFRKGDEENWAKVETSAGEFKSISLAIERFKIEFGFDIKGLYDRCLFLENETKNVIGTTTAWYGSDKFSRETGRIHWVAIKEEYQGKKLAKPLLSSALKILSKYHKKAYLTTQTTSYKAINMYLNFGFVPVIFSADDKRAWNLLYEVLKHPKLIYYK